MGTGAHRLIRLLTAADLPACMRLKDAAGWNQTEQDWRNVLELEPEGCFGMECDAGWRLRPLRSVTSDLAWIGMVLTAPEEGVVEINGRRVEDPVWQDAGAELVVQVGQNGCGCA